MFNVFFLRFFGYISGREGRRGSVPPPARSGGPDESKPTVPESLAPRVQKLEEKTAPLHRKLMLSHSSVFSEIAGAPLTPGAPNFAQ